MRLFPLVPLGRAAMCACLVAWPGSLALAQSSTSPPPGNLQPPSHAHAATPAKPAAPQTTTAAPREPVHQATPGKQPTATVKPPAHPAKIAPPTHGHAKPKVTAAPAGPPPPAEPAPPAAPQAPAEIPKGSATGLPLPRFAALRSDEVNMRAGPGTRYPIVWVYKRRDLPVQIEREFEVWRLVRDPEGTKGWVHQATLTGRRTVVVTGTTRTLRRQPDDQSPATAELKPGVIGRIRSCEAGSAWCQVQVGDYRGYLKRDEVWGMRPDEAVTN